MLKPTVASEVADRIIAGGSITKEEALDLLKNAPRQELYDAAHRVGEKLAPRRFDFCSIINARAGKCSENCKWCAQSAHYKTGMQCHGWVGTEACVEAAKNAERNGVGHIGIVTAGRGQTKEDVDNLCEALRAMKRETKVHLCASLGLVSEEDLRRLKEAGLERYHCNIETAPSYFGQMCSTHTPEQKFATLEAAKRVGLEVCSGGIIGLGESDEQLVEFAFALARVGAPSIPVNILHPIEGTPLGKSPLLPTERILSAISVIRLVNPRSGLRFAGGRAQLSDDDARKAIYCGISAGIAGPMLTTPGPNYSDDRALAEEAGFDVSQPMRTDA